MVQRNLKVQRNVTNASILMKQLNVTSEITTKNKVYTEQERKLSSV